jgi:outer membrane protein
MTFNGLKNNKRISSAKIETQKSKFKIDQETLQVNQQLELENKKRVNYGLIHEKLVCLVEFAEASFKTTQAKFSAGSVDAFSFSMAKNNLLVSEYNLLKNKLQSQYISYKINLIQANTL